MSSNKKPATNPPKKTGDKVPTASKAGPSKTSTAAKASPSKTSAVKAGPSKSSRPSSPTRSAALPVPQKTKEQKEKEAVAFGNRINNSLGQSMEPQMKQLRTALEALVKETTEREQHRDFMKQYIDEAIRIVFLRTTDQAARAEASQAGHLGGWHYEARVQSAYTEVVAAYRQLMTLMYLEGLTLKGGGLLSKGNKKVLLPADLTMLIQDNLAKDAIEKIEAAVIKLRAEPIP